MATYHRILDATERLLRTQRFDEISINDLCAEALVSTSSLYARFPHKDAILHSVFDRYVDRVREATIHGLDEVSSDSNDPIELVRQIIERFLAFSRTNAEMMMVLSSDQRLFERRWEIDETVTASARNLVAQQLGVTDSKTLFNLEFAVRAMSSVASRAMGPPVFWAETMRLSDAQLAEEMTKMAIGYLHMVTDEHDFANN